jgi:23S rRNA (guanosine2251-2'-O)-methyltransferase
VGEGAGISFIGMPELLKTLKTRGPDGLVLVLDSITDSNNFGAILRTAAAANVDAVVFPERRSAQVNDAAIRSSAGTAGRVPLARVVNLGRAIDELKAAGFWVYGMSAAKGGGKNYLDEKFDAATVIALGSEGEGMRPKIRERCDSMLEIEMPGQTDSLNVSSAAAVALFRVLAVREKKY